MKQNNEHRNLLQTTVNGNNFTLTPEELELVKIAIEMSIEVCDAMVKGLCGDDYEAVPNGFNNIITRIKKWQIENQ